MCDHPTSPAPPTQAWPPAPRVTELDPRAWRTLAGQVFADLGRSVITPTQALIMERLIRVTLLRGRQSVRILRLESFDRFKLDKAKISRALQGAWIPNQSARDRKWVPGLTELRLLDVTETSDGGAVFTVLPDATQWRCGWRFQERDDQEFLAELDAVADQVQPELLPRDMELKDALAAVNLERALGCRFGNDPPRSGDPPVAESATTFPPVRPTDVAESATGAPCLLGSGSPGSQNQDCKVASLKNQQGPPAPGPLTLQPCNLGQAAGRKGEILNPERQELLQAMEELGFWTNDPTAKWNWLRFVRSEPLDRIVALIGDVRYRQQIAHLPKLVSPGAYANSLLRR